MLYIRRITRRGSGRWRSLRLLHVSVFDTVRNHRAGKDGGSAREHGGEQLFGGWDSDLRRESNTPRYSLLCR